ncbi:MAG: TonB-dependent receptor [Pseudomonadota bacterium]
MQTFKIASGLPLKSTLLACSASALLLVAPHQVAAQESSLDGVETISVGSLRLPTPITETGSAISIITSQDLDNLGVDFVLDALTLSPGVTINQNGAIGGQASVRIRGNSSEQTLVLVDGIPVNDASTPGGGYNFARLDPENVERVEILRGPQSTLWGTDAIGGVVSITTKRPTDGLHGTGFFEFGSFETFRGGLSGSYGGKRGDIRIGASGISSGGISRADEANGNTEDDSFESGTLSANGGLNFGSDIRLEGSILYNRSDSEFDSFSFASEGGVSDGDELSEVEDLATRVSLYAPVFDGRLENLLVFGYTQTDRANFRNGNEMPNFEAKSQRVILRYQGTANITDGYRLLFGVENDSSESNDTDEIDILGLFGVFEAQPIDGLTLSAGVRYDDNSEFGSETTFRAAAAYQVSDEFTVRGSWGEGFKAPTIFQLTQFFSPAMQPNPDLRPERSNGFDLGVDWRSSSNRAAVSLTYFNQDTTDQINFADGSYFNIARAETQGIELSVQYEVLDGLTVAGDYSLIDAQDQDGDTLQRVPRNTANLRLEYASEGPFSGNIAVRYNGDEIDRRGIVDNWVRVDLAAQYRFTENIEAFARIENLLDAQYQQILGFGTPGFSGSVGFRVRL